MTTTMANLGKDKSIPTNLDLWSTLYTIPFMSTEFDWFMVTMPIFALVVYAIVMVGSMEKQPKFLESKSTEKIVIYAFGVLFGAGVLVSCWYMFVRFFDLLASY